MLEQVIFQAWIVDISLERRNSCEAVTAEVVHLPRSAVRCNFSRSVASLTCSNVQFESLAVCSFFCSEMSVTRLKKEKLVRRLIALVFYVKVHLIVLVPSLLARFPFGLQAESLCEVIAFLKL